MHDLDFGFFVYTHNILLRVGQQLPNVAIGLVVDGLKVRLPGLFGDVFTHQVDLSRLDRVRRVRPVVPAAGLLLKFA